MILSSRSVASDGSEVCFICEKTDEKEPLSKLSSWEKPSIENLLAESSNSQLLAKFQGLWDNHSNTNIIYYHGNCKHEIFNTAKTSSRKRTSEASLEREESRKKKQRLCTVRDSEVLPYKDKCIHCNELVCLHLCNPAKAKKTHTRPDNETKDRLKSRLLKRVEERLSKNPDDKWAIEVKGRLMGMNDLVAEEVLLRKRCNTNFFSERGNQHSEVVHGRNQTKVVWSYSKSCATDWKRKIEDNLFTLDQLHEKLVSFEKTPDKALTYTKRYLKQMLEERWMYFTSQGRRTDVLCFKDLTASIIREHHNNKEDDDKTKIIKNAVKLKLH